MERNWTETDLAMMGRALELARGVLGAVAPNPAVGCVIARGETLVAQAATQPGGRPHAETQALELAGEKARGATAYVTLEPCSHHGATPPCVQALINARVREVVAACRDPDRRVAGKGLKKLEAAGLTVRLGLLEFEALELNAGFFKRTSTGRPLLRLSQQGAGHDRLLEPARGESLQEALDRLGGEGVTRAWLKPGSEPALEAQRLGLLDSPPSFGADDSRSSAG